MTENAITVKIREILTPYFGAEMAQGILLISCMMSDIDIQYINNENLQSIAPDIEKRMKIFLGTEKAKAVANMIPGIKV